jgi:hypothetical protein
MTRSVPLPAVKPKPQGGPWRTGGDCERPPLGGLAPARVISPSQAHMKYETLGGLRGRNGVLGRGASCLREGGGRGTLSRPIRNALAYPGMGGGRGWGMGWGLGGGGRRNMGRGRGGVPGSNEGAISQSFTITHSRTHFSANQQVFCKFAAKNQESDAAWVRVSGFCVRAVCAQPVPRRVRVKADACAAFRMGSLMIPTSLGHSWK